MTHLATQFTHDSGSFVFHSPEIFIMGFFKRRISVFPKIELSTFVISVNELHVLTLLCNSVDVSYYTGPKKTKGTKKTVNCIKQIYT
jgi:hypothetical protein